MNNILNEVAKWVYNAASSLDLTNPFRVIILIIDITCVAFLIYYMYRLIKNTRAEQIAKGIVFIVVLQAIANVINMPIIKFLFSNLMTYAVMIAIVVFQPELRKAFASIGSKGKIGEILEDVENDSYISINSIMQLANAVETMSQRKIGALIVIEKETKIEDITDEGIKIGAEISSELLQNIFVPNTSLHDGAVVIDRDKIVSAKCILPLSSEETTPKSLGTRHRAAIGISEVSDAISVIVSEETGIISIAQNGKIKRNFAQDTLQEYLFSNLCKEYNKFARVKTKKSRKNK